MAPIENFYDRRAVASPQERPVLLPAITEPIDHLWTGEKVPFYAILNPMPARRELFKMGAASALAMAARVHAARLKLPSTVLGPGQTTVTHEPFGDLAIYVSGPTDQVITKVVPGSMMYCAAGTLHGIVNTGKDALLFYFYKWKV